MTRSQSRTCKFFRAFGICFKPLSGHLPKLTYPAPLTTLDSLLRKWWTARFTSTAPSLATRTKGSITWSLGLVRWLISTIMGLLISRFSSQGYSISLLLAKRTSEKGLSSGLGESSIHRIVVQYSKKLTGERSRKQWSSWCPMWTMLALLLIIGCSDLPRESRVSKSITSSLTTTGSCPLQRCSFRTTAFERSLSKPTICTDGETSSPAQPTLTSPRKSSRSTMRWW